MTERSHDSDNDWTGWIIPAGALVIAGALLAWALWPRGSDAPPTQSTAGPTPVATIPDPHIVVSPGGTFRFVYEEGAVVVSQVNSPPGELGRIAIPADVQPNASGDFTTANRDAFAIFALACPSNVRGIEPRMVFGFSSTLPVDYSGPPAAGGFAPDGMWLFVLDPGALDPGATLKVATAGTTGSNATMRGATLIDAQANGIAQPSGCWLVR